MTTVFLSSVFIIHRFVFCKRPHRLTVLNNIRREKEITVDKIIKKAVEIYFLNYLPKLAI